MQRVPGSLHQRAVAKEGPMSGSLMLAVPTFEAGTGGFRRNLTDRHRPANNVMTPDHAIHWWVIN